MHLKDGYYYLVIAEGALWVSILRIVHINFRYRWNRAESYGNGGEVEADNGSLRPSAAQSAPFQREHDFIL
jgi:hypothetical protein